MRVGSGRDASCGRRHSFGLRFNAVSLGVALFGSCLFVTDLARAEAPPQRPLRLSVRSTTCIHESEFWDALAKRTPRVRPAAPGEAAPLVTIDIGGHEGSRIVGRLWISDGQGQRPAARVVSGESCDEVVATMSLMTALVFDPEASASPRASPPPAPPPTPPVAPPPIAAPPPPAPIAAPPVPMHWSLSAGGRGLMSTMNDIALGAGLFADLERVSGARPVTAWLASIRLTASFALLDISAGAAHGRATWRIVDLDLCPWRAALPGILTFRPCASLEGGTLDITADGVRDARPFTRPWLAPGVRTQLTWAVLDPVVFGLDASAAIPLVRDEFTIEPLIRLFRAPIVTASFGAFLGIRFL